MNSKIVKYIIKRILMALFTIFLIITITFFAMNIIPGGPFISEKSPSERVIQELNKKYGLDKPLFEQYINYLLRVLRFDFGPSIKYLGRNVVDIIKDGFKTSGKLGLIAAVVSLVVGTFLGTLAAVKRNKWQDKVIMVVTTACVAMPSFVIGTFLLIIFCVRLQWFPANGETSAGLVLPVVALSLYPSSYITRLARSGMLDVLGQDFIRTAKAKGVPYAKIIYKHALKNALIPIITYAGPMIANILTGSMVVEKIFTVSGLGTDFINSIINRDYMVIMGTTIFLASFIVIMTLVCDLLYKVVDPRIELE